MSLLGIFSLAIVLSLDAMAVGAANGAYHHRMAFSKAFRIAFFFGFFQFVMPLIGWQIGSGLEQIVRSSDHWVAFTLLAILGIKMLIESAKEDKDRTLDADGLKILFLLAIATSIDALVVGITFAFVTVQIWFSVITIGLTTFGLSLASVYAGKKFGESWGKKAEVLGGIIIIGIGFKILLSHLLG